MKLLINGQEKEIGGGLNLKQLLTSLQVNPYTVVVEHNEAVIHYKKFESVKIVEGDKIEIVHFVGGGMSS